MQKDRGWIVRLAMVMAIAALTSAMTVNGSEKQSAQDSSFGVIKDHYHWTPEGILTRGVVSLREFSWADDMPWVRDFEYESLLMTKEGNIGAVPRYTPQMVSDHVDSLRVLPWVQPSQAADERMIIGHTAGWPEDKHLPIWRYDDYGDPAVPSLPIYGFTVTAPDSNAEKLQVVAVAGNHSSEMHGSWALHGMVDFLVSDDPRAAKLRQRVAFHFYPLACPESRYHHVRLPTVPTLAGLPIPERRVVEHYPLRGGPELYAHSEDLGYWRERGALGGAPDHNRVWNTTGKFTTIDTIVAAMRKDTSGEADYVWDFHGGYPHDPGDYRGSAEAMNSPYAQVLQENDWPYSQVLRRTSRPAADMLRGWSMTDQGLNAYAFTYEPGQQLTKRQVLESGKNLALGFYILVRDD